MDNVPCDQITILADEECSKDERINTLRFRINQGDCGDSDNNQNTGTFSPSCSNPPGPLPQNVKVTCVDVSAQAILGMSSLQLGDTIEVQNPSGTTLPDVISCRIMDTDDNNLHMVSINTSGDIPLFLKDKFGAFELEACQFGTITKDCIVPIEYSYTVSNAGENPLFFTSVDSWFRQSTDL